MDRVNAWCAAAAAVFRRDLMVFTSYRLQAVSQVFSAIVSVSMFYYVSRLVQTDAFASKDTYFAFVVVGVVIAQMITATLGTIPMTIRGDLMAGTLERFLVSEFGVVSGTVAMLIFPTTLALLSGVATIVSGVVLFGLPVHGSTLVLAIPAAILASIAFVPFTLAFAATVLAFKQVPPGASYLVVGLTLVSGLYFPVDLLPSWIRWVQEVQPYSPAVELLRYLISGVPLDGSPWVLVGRIAAFGIVLMPLSLWLLGRAVVFGRRRGSLIEY